MTRRISLAAPLLALALSACMGAGMPPKTVIPQAAGGAFAEVPVASIAPVPDHSSPLAVVSRLASASALPRLASSPSHSAASAST